MIRLLDTTLRDGGLGLEDANINKISTKNYSKKRMNSIKKLLTRANVDIIELGSIEISNNDKRCFGIYQSIEQISETMPKRKNCNQMFAALFRGPDTPAESIPQWSNNLCECIRVIIRYSELEKSLEFCKMLAKKGYKVFIQPMLTMRYTLDELRLLIKYANEMKAYALYFVDSYGYMTAKDVEYFYKMFDELLDSSIQIGFHAHNNMNLAYSNVLHFIEISRERDVIVDSCVMGIGQGAGNLQTELIVPFLNNQQRKYDYNSILDACEEVEPLLGNQLWGYSVCRLLPALHKTAYKYSVCFRHKYRKSFKEINWLLENMPEELRHRYTPENAEYIVSKLKNSEND